MTEPIVDDDRLDVYRLPIEYVASLCAIASELNAHHRHVRDQWLRAAQSIPLNVAQGNGTRNGSARDCVAIQDILGATNGLDDPCHAELKRTLHRIVSMLTRLIARSDFVAEPGAECHVEIEYEYHDAEYEYAYEDESKPQQATRAFALHAPRGQPRSLWRRRIS